MLAYSALRLLVFVGVAALFSLAGLRGFPLVLVALLVSGLVSYGLLARARAALALRVEERLEERRRQQAAADARLDEPEPPAG